MRQKIILNDPILNEIAYDYLFSITQNQRKILNAKELRAIRSKTRAKQYVSRATQDEKYFLLSKLGCGFSLVLHNGDPLRTADIKELYEKYKTMSKSEIIGDMAKRKIVVTSDRILINFLNVLADYSHSDSYLLNLDFHKVGQKLTHWKENKMEVDNVQEALDYAKVINKFSLMISISLKELKGVFEISDLDLNILMYLYDQRSRYVLRTAIEEYFGGMYKRTLISASLKRLDEKVLIERDPTQTYSRVQYQITALGNTAVMDFHKRNLSQTV